MVLQLAAATATARATVTAATFAGREAGANGEGRDSDRCQNARNDSFHCNSPINLGMDGFLHSVPVAKGPRLQFGKPKTLFRMSVGSRAALPSAFGFDVSADGRRFLLPVGPEPAASSLVVIQNWESLLDKH